MTNINKFLLAVFLSLVCVPISNADDSAGSWEGEIFAGPLWSVGKSFELDDYTTAIESKPLIGYSFGAELRRNLNKVPLDFGVRLAFSKVGYNVAWQANDNSPVTWGKSYTNSFTLAAVGDWSLNRGGVVAPFVGAGIGMAVNEFHKSAVRFYAMPRIGLGIKNAVRLSVSANFSDETHNNILLTVGYVFGKKMTDIHALGDMVGGIKSNIDALSANRHIKSTDTVLIPYEIRKLTKQGNVCMWTGVGALCVGIPAVITGLSFIGMADEGGAIVGGIITGFGGLVTLSSVPLFIVSQKKKSDAVRLALQMSAMKGSNPVGVSSAIPAVGLSVNF